MSDLNSESAHALAGELRVTIGRLSRRLREHAGLGELSWPQMTVLGRLERDGPATLTALAKAEGVRSQSLGETIAGLKAAGLVTGAPDPNDGRQTVLSVTDACREMIRVSRASREDWLYGALQSKLTPAEQDHLAAAIDLLKRLAD